jgi:hypothetical protein
MEPGLAFSVIAGAWGLAMVAVLISAIRLCYRVEERSDALRNRTGLPMRAQWLQVIANAGVARDAETQALRRQAIRRFLAILAGFALFGLVLRFAGPGG